MLTALRECYPARCLRSAACSGERHQNTRRCFGLWKPWRENIQDMVIETLAVDRNGRLDLVAAEAQLAKRDDVALVSFMLANNEEPSVLQPVSDLLCWHARAGPCCIATPPRPLGRSRSTSASSTPTWSQPEDA